MTRAKKTDLRTQRTKVAIENALIDLIEQRGFDALSVEDISRKALINRTTFYRYYKDKFALVEDIYKRAIRKFAEDAGRPMLVRNTIVHGYPRKADDERFQAAWVRLFDHFASNSRLYKAMLCGMGCTWFQAKMREHLVKFFRAWHQVQRKQVRKNTSDFPSSIAQALFADAIIRTITYWLEGGMKYSSSQIVYWFRRLAREGYIRVLGWA